VRTATVHHGDVFAGNRARAKVALSVTARDGVARRERVHEDGALRVRFPNAEGGALDAVLVNTAGGMTGGDRFAVDVAVGEGARLTVTTAAAEKVYRSLAPDTAVDLNISIGAHGMLRWLPHETILFDHARLARDVRIDLAPGGALLFAEAVVFGRAAMGETVTEGRLFDRWRVRRGGRLVFAETMNLDGPIAARLASSAVANGGVALATVLAIPGDDTKVAAVRALEAQFAGEVGISAWNGVAVARLCASDGARLRHDLMLVLAALSDLPLPRLWLN
jgi:urease accessory protein